MRALLGWEEEIPMRPILVLAVAILAASPAAAVDGKFYPASMCQAANATHAARADYTGNGRVCNTSQSASLTLRCPIVREIQAGHITFARVYAKNANPSQDLNCVLRTLRPDTVDGWGWFQSFAFGLGPFNNPDAWQSWSSFADMGQVGDGPYELSCTLPPAVSWTTGVKQSCLGAYRIDEE
jgi:hypothetical protein